MNPLLITASCSLLGIVIIFGLTSIIRNGISTASINYIYPTTTALFYLAGLPYFASTPNLYSIGINAPEAYYFLETALWGAALHCFLVLAPSILLNRGQRHVKLDTRQISNLIQQKTHLILLLSTAIIITASFSYGFDNLWSRRDYQVSHPSVIRQSLQGLGETLAALGPLLLGALFYSVRSPGIKIASFGMLVIYLAYFLGSTTRLAAVAPLLFFSCKWFVSKPRVHDFLPIGFLLIVSSILLSSIIATRDLSSFGLSMAFSFLSDKSQISTTLLAVPENLLSPIWISALTLLTTGGPDTLPVSDFATSVNPAPGFIAGWYDISESLRYSTSIPFNTVGELISYGYPLLIGFSLAIGCVTLLIRESLRKSKNVSVLVITIAMLLLAALIGLQYNLRSVSRQFYYLLFIALIAAPAFKISLRFLNKSSSTK